MRREGHAISEKERLVVLRRMARDGQVVDDGSGGWMLAPAFEARFGHALRAFAIGEDAGLDAAA